MAVGGNNPLRLQSMTTTPTMDTEGTVTQVKKLADVGCEIARITAPTVNEARNLGNIKSSLLKSGYTIPLVADIHFRPDAAMVAADFVEKVRVNPGNFVDGKAFKVREYTDVEYQKELDRLEETFTPLVLKMKKLNRSMRIGTNHGSLSDRVMNRFGDTPLGMVESALEYLRVCEKNNYHEVIFSMKASNPKVMIEAYRLLAERMDQLGMDYPFHLGVTEAGGGEDGRIKSSIGIGSLLEDGIGDTIRVSLTEDPEFEIPVAKELADRYLSAPSFPALDKFSSELKESYKEESGVVSRRHSISAKTGPLELGGSSPVRIISRINLKETKAADVVALLEERVKKDTPPEILEIPYFTDGFLEKFNTFRGELLTETQRLGLWVTFSSGHIPDRIDFQADGYGYQCGDTIDEQELARMAEVCRRFSVPLIAWSQSPESLLHLISRLKGATFPVLAGLEGKQATSNVHPLRILTAGLRAAKSSVPIIISTESEEGLVGSSVVAGSLLCDGIGDAIRMSGGPLTSTGLDFAYNLLQGTGNRITKTEYVSCPSCGRTLFDLQSTTERIRSKTGHLKGVKIAIMGCIVNGPGEMADADFGYVGGGPGKINLYVGKQCIEKSIPTEIADEKLISLIKAHGKWVEPLVEAAFK